MRNLKRFLAVVAVVMTCVVSSARANDNPLHNSLLPTDVDANGSVQPLDFLLVVNELQQVHSLAAPIPIPSATPSTSYYWDTSNDSRVTPLDALLVANQLLAAAALPSPEPSTFVMGGMGLLFLAGYAWRKRRLKT